MYFDPDNCIVKLCAHGMSMEGEGRQQEASETFMQAWKQSENDFEKAISAHYVARHQQTAGDKLKWDQLALEHAKNSNDPAATAMYPSLYLNIAKDYEDLNDYLNAEKNYELALSFVLHLKDDGYGKLIRSGITQGIYRIRKKI